eukprot:TRINITY_DN13179_c0_g1_i1.p1 TRINITY_DN13179_c0_g1~~TRINITY_DN13179_c0_g1_i1.p1  ORF type:complete len:262 (+),score=53.81 TRINITY_DN13179_c0_g1_i1:139-924(+)
MSYRSDYYRDKRYSYSREYSDRRYDDRYSKYYEESRAYSDYYDSRGREGHYDERYDRSYTRDNRQIHYDDRYPPHSSQYQSGSMPVRNGYRDVRERYYYNDRPSGSYVNDTPPYPKAHTIEKRPSEMRNSGEFPHPFTRRSSSDNVNTETYFNSLASFSVNVKLSRESTEKIQLLRSNSNDIEAVENELITLRREALELAKAQDAIDFKFLNSKFKLTQAVRRVNVIDADLEDTEQQIDKLMETGEFPESNWKLPLAPETQ